MTPAFVKTLKALRNALLEDDDRIDELKEKLAEVMDKDKIQLNDRTPISDASEAIRRPPFACCRRARCWRIWGLLEDDVDLLDILEEALEKGQGADAAVEGVARPNCRRSPPGSWRAAIRHPRRHEIADRRPGSTSRRQSKNTAPDLEKQVQNLSAASIHHGPAQHDGTRDGRIAVEPAIAGKRSSTRCSSGRSRRRSDYAALTASLYRQPPAAMRDRES